MSLTQNIRIFNTDKTFDILCQITAPLIQHIKDGKYINGSMITYLDELYMELVKRGELIRLSDIEEKEKKKYWIRAKGTGETDTAKLIQHSRSFYVAEKVSS